MKRLLLCVCAVMSLLLSSTFVPAQVVVNNSVVNEITKTFNSLFDGLKRGDVGTIQFYLLPEEYARSKVLLEQNTDYPRFLKNFYHGATLRIGKVDSVLSTPNEVIAEFIVDFPSGETSITRMRLNRGDSGIWKIKKILADKNDQGEPSGTGPR
jgi:hypothetical protein